MQVPVEIPQDMDIGMEASPIGDQPSLGVGEDIKSLDEFGDEDNDLGDFDDEEIAGNEDEI